MAVSYADLRRRFYHSADPRTKADLDTIAFLENRIQLIENNCLHLDHYEVEGGAIWKRCLVCHKYLAFKDGNEDWDWFHKPSKKFMEVAL